MDVDQGMRPWAHLLQPVVCGLLAEASGLSGQTAMQRYELPCTFLACHLLDSVAIVYLLSLST